MMKSLGFYLLVLSCLFGFCCAKKEVFGFKNDPVRLTCSLSGNNVDWEAIKWFKAGELIDLKDEMLAELDSSSGTSELLIKKLKEEDGGEYHCGDTSKEDKISDPILLTIPSKPKFIYNDNITTVLNATYMDNVVLVCESEGNDVTLEWYREGSKFDQSGFKMTEEKKDDKTRSTMKFVALSIYNEWVLTCKAEFGKTGRIFESEIKLYMEWFEISPWKLALLIIGTLFVSVILPACIWWFFCRRAA